MDPTEKRLAAGLVFGIEGDRTWEVWVEAFRASLARQPSLVRESGDLNPEQTAAWEQLKASQEGRVLFDRARYRIAWNDKREATKWARSLASQPLLCGRGRFIEVASPVEVVEWKWPLATAVIEDLGRAEAQANIAELMDSDPSWLRILIRPVKTPADQAGAADILIFPQGWKAGETLFAARAPVTAELLVLCGLSGTQFDEVAAGAEELLELTQANAILAVDARIAGMSWLPMLIEQLAHDEPLDVAVAQALRLRNLDPGLMLAFSTPLFIERARISTFTTLVTERLHDLDPNFPIELHGTVRWMPSRMPAVEAAELLEGKIDFRSESLGASGVAAVAAALPPYPPSPVRAKRLREPFPRAASARFLLHKLAAQETTRFRPAEALEAAKRYKLNVRIGGRRKGYLSGEVSFPEPPVQRGDAGAILTVVFFEKNSKPEAELKPIFLPMTGDSSACEFEFIASPVSSLFEGWVSVYHNNRLLQEGVLRARVEGAAAPAAQTVQKTSFTIPSSPRPLALGLAEQRLFAGTIRLEGDGVATGIRGYRYGASEPSGAETGGRKPGERLQPHALGGY